jgi:hypothetical protein
MTFVEEHLRVFVQESGFGHLGVKVGVSDLLRMSFDRITKKPSG